MREIPDLNCLKRRHSPPREFIDLAHEQPRKERKTTAGDQDHAHKHEQEEDVILVSADGTLDHDDKDDDDDDDVRLVSADGCLHLKSLLEDTPTTKTTTTKDGTRTIEAENQELTKRLASLE